MTTYRRTYCATSPDSMNGATNEQLRQRYVLDELFTPDALVPHYTHFERLVVSGAAPVHG